MRLCLNLFVDLHSRICGALREVALHRPSALALSPHCILYWSFSEAVEQSGILQGKRKANFLPIIAHLPSVKRIDRPHGPVKTIVLEILGNDLLKAVVFGISPGCASNQLSLYAAVARNARRKMPSLG